MNSKDLLGFDFNAIKDLKKFETHSHSEFSNLRLLDCINRPKDLLLTAAALGYSGLAITDHECLSSHVKFLKLEKELKEKEKLPKDFKLGLGNEIYLTDTRDKSQKYFHFILIAKDTLGHRALRELSSTAWYNSYYDRGMERVPTLKKELEEIVNKYPGCLIGCTACLGGELATLVNELVKLERKNNIDEINNIKGKIVDFIQFGKKLFGEDFYIEIAPAQSPDQVSFNTRVRSIAAAMGVKMIFATDAHYLTEKDRAVHKAYLNSKDGDREVDDFYQYSHLMDNVEAYSNLFPYFTIDEYSQMCANTIEIMNKIGTYEIFHNPIIPEVEVKHYLGVKDESIFDYPTLYRLRYEGNDAEKYWVNECLIALKKKNLENEVYLQRLETEAKVIDIIGQKLGNCLFSYFNTFQHYIDLFWECGSLSGPGRGSSVCFLSNYLLGITQLDPVVWELDYWRFLNEERVELPDIDTDLSPSKRKLIFKKIREERGELNVLQVATFGTEGTRSAIQTACRGYRSEEYPNGIDVDIAQYLSGLIPQERGFLWSLEDVVNGNEEKDRKPIKSFIMETNKYPGLLDIMMSIEGLVNKRGQHASGVILYNSSPFETGALMRSPNGDLITQFSLHDAEALGDTKFDFLVTEVCDKLTNGINLLKEDGYFSECNSLREIYEKYFHPAVIPLEDTRIWDSLARGDTMDVFQFNSDVGLQAAKAIKPRNPIEMTMANALMRLMGEKGQERPLERYVRLKNNFSLWYEEVENRGLKPHQISILEKYYVPRFGVPAMQEDLMKVCMDEDIAHFTLKEANDARKIVAKKKMDQIGDLKEKFISQCEDANFGEYVWETTMGPQMGYSFALPHSLAYSFVGIQTLMVANLYPSIYWNCGCLITNSGGNEDAEDEELETKITDIDVEEDDEEETDDKKKKKQRTANYGKISTAIGQMTTAGIQVSPPDINKSSFTFVPDIDNNRIIYGIKGITRVGADVIASIMENRPYSSVEDFLSKVKVNKPQMVNLIKSGAFDQFGDREIVMKDYIDSITEKKQRLTLQNMQMLIKYNLLPKELEFEIKVFNFNKYLKKKKVDQFSAYKLDEIADNFYSAHYDQDLTWYEEVTCGSPTKLISQKDWDAIYKKEMDPVRDHLKENKDIILNKLNDTLFKENWNKYCKGTVSQWEMDSIGFYYHEHELEKMNETVQNIKNFNELPVEPQIKTVMNIQGKEIPIYELYRIAGTVIDKNKNKNSITLLTKYGVVNVKIYQAQYAKFDKQISEKLEDGTKKVMEKSWFSRGTKLVVTGMRRDDTFQLKKYKNTPYEVVEKIIYMDENGEVALQKKRYGEED
jgi:DNA polymerase-3 subunit alpha